LQYSKLSNLKILFFIPRRCKGHTEILSSVDVLSYTSMNAEDFVEFFISYQKKVLTKDTILELCTSIVDRLKVTEFVMNVNFLLPVDRLSSTLEESISFNLDCKYSFVYSKGISTLSMKIDCPVRINHISTLKGNLTFQISNPSPNIYFEDLLDIVLKYGNVVIYPIIRTSDKKTLMKEIDQGKPIDDYLNFIRVAAIHKNLSDSGGLVSVSFVDLYNSYDIEKGVTW